MFERGIEPQDIREVVDHGEVIETYPDDAPLPSRLVRGWRRGRPLHVVAADNTQDQITVIITVYVPDAGHWEPPEYRRRRT